MSSRLYFKTRKKGKHFENLIVNLKLSESFGEFRIYFELAKILVFSSCLEKLFLESLILAQDERWRRG